MFLVKDNRHGAAYLVFTWGDPRKAGYDGPVTEVDSLGYDMDTVHRWEDGEARPEACVGQAPDDPRHYRVFKYSHDLQSAGYHPIPGTPVVVGSWTDYLKLHHPDDLTEEEWFQELDRFDEASRRRRQRAQEPALPAGTSRDEVAAWVAKRHFFADDAIREVWYLPRGAPQEEIRLLELNDRLARSEDKAEAIDFGLDVEGAQFRLLVADITSEQLEEIKKDPSRLPPGWSLDGNTVWRRKDRLWRRGA